MPDPLVHVGRDRERAGLLGAVLDHVEARVLDRREVGHDVVVAEVLAPRLDPGLHLLDRLAVGPDLDQRGRGQRRVVRVQLDDGALGLRGVVAHLREADDGRAGPARNRVRLDGPLGDLAGGLRRQRRPDDEPAVLREVAAVEELQLTRQGPDHDVALGILGRHREGLPRGDRESLDVVLVAMEVERGVPLELPDLPPGRKGRGRACRVAREDGGLAVHQVRALPVPRRQELEVESRAAFEGGRQRLVEVHGDPEAGAVRRHDDPRVEVERFVTQRHLDGVGLRIDLPIHDLRNLVPLLGRGAQADRAPGCRPDAVVNDLDAGRLLVEEHAVVLVREDEDVEPPLLEVLLVVDRQRPVLDEGDRSGQAECDREGSDGPGGPRRRSADTRLGAMLDLRGGACERRVGTGSRARQRPLVMMQSSRVSDKPPRPGCGQWPGSRVPVGLQSYDMVGPEVLRPEPVLRGRLSVVPVDADGAPAAG